MEQNKKKKKTGLSKKFFIRFWSAFALFLLCIVLFFVCIELEFFGTMPSFEELENPKSMLASEIYSADGELLGKYYLENRSNIHYTELSSHLVSALVATEDARFYEHSGIDIRALGRALKGIGTGDRKGGASTITQQLVKNLFPRGKLNKAQLFIRKIQEWVTAVKVERSYTKEEIIAMYFNTMDFGSQSFGIKSAAWTFFHKEPKELNMEESALLVAILNAPTRYSPVQNPDRATQRRNLVLAQMQKYGYITQHVCDSVQQLPLDVSLYSIQDQNAGLAPYFREYLRQELKKWCENHQKADGTPYNLYKDGLRIYTTIDSRMQRYAEEAVREWLGGELQQTFFNHWKEVKTPNAPFSRVSDADIARFYEKSKRNSDRYRNMREEGYTEQQIDSAFNTPVRMRVFSWKTPIDTIMSPKDSIKYYYWFLRSALMAIEPHTGYVKAYVGGPDYRYFKYDQVKYAKRQVGSTFKPFVYTMAIQEKGYTPCTEIPKVQPSIELPDGRIWAPSGSKDRIGQMVTLKWALANSDNWISAYLMKEVSPQSVINLVRKMGITSPIDPVPSICLGTADLTLCEMVSAFNTYPSQGIFIEPVFVKRIEDKYGNILENFVPNRTEVMSEETAYTMLRVMQGVAEGGTASRLRYRYQLMNPIAGKTGTTQHNSDGWFIGMTPYLTTGVWTGGELRSIHFRLTTYGQGAHMSLPIWARFMQKIYADPTINMPKGDFPKPTSGYEVNFDCSREGKKWVEDF